MAKQTSSKSSASAAKRKPTSEAPTPITKVIVKAEPMAASRVGAPAVATSQDVVVGALPSHDEIAQRAFELYQTRGYGDGGELNDWLRAERELRA